MEVVMNVWWIVGLVATISILMSFAISGARIADKDKEILSLKHELSIVSSQSSNAMVMYQEKERELIEVERKYRELANRVPGEVVDIE